MKTRTEKEQMALVKVYERTFKATRALADAMNPEEFRSAMTGLLCVFAEAMDTDYWARFSTVTPCSKPGCDCHLVGSPQFVALMKVLRDKHKPDTTLSA